MYSAQEVAEAIVQTCEREHGKRSLHGILSACGLPYIVDTLKKGSMPSIDKLAIVADALNVSLDELLGRHQKSAPQISPLELRLLNAFRILSDFGKGELLGRAELLAEQEREHKKDAAV